MLGGEAQYTDWYPRLKWIAPNKTELLQKLQSDKEIYLSVKERLSATYLK